MLDKKIDTILDLQNVKFKTRAKMRGTDSSSTSNSRWCTLHYYFLLNVSLLRIEQLNGFTLSQVKALRKTLREVSSNFGYKTFVRSRENIDCKEKWAVSCCVDANENFVLFLCDAQANRDCIRNCVKRIPTSKQ